MGSKDATHRRQSPTIRSLIRPIRPPRPWIAWIVLTVSFLSTATITLIIWQTFDDKDAMRFESAQARVVRALSNRIELHTALLHAGSGLFSLERTLSAGEFEAFHRQQNLDVRFPGIWAVGFARYAPVEKTDSLQRLILGNYGEGIAVRPTITPHEHRFVITLASTESPVDSLIGLDLFGSSGGRRALRAAIAAGRTRLFSIDSILPNRTPSRPRGKSFILLSPAYDLGVIPQRSEERISNIRGFFFDIFTAEALLADIKEDFLTSVISYAVFDGDSASADNLLYRSDPDLDLEVGRFQTFESVDIAGERWTFAFAHGPQFDQTSGRETVPLIAFAGFLFSLGLFYLTRSQVKAFEQLETSALSLERAQSELAELNRDLEHHVRQRTAELENSNNELKAFAYSVSHDLRAPLRGIDGFSKFLLEDYAESLDDTAKDYLRRVREGTQRMGAIIDDLLTLSRVTRWEMEFELLDLSAMATQIVDILRERDPERTVEVRIQPGMRVRADRRLVSIILENLFDNAWKFSSRQKEAVITFSREVDPDADGRFVYVVADNGAGFEQKYASELFESFRRLHSPHDFPGTGIGLATVKRAISRHDGTIRADGRPEEGARFIFTLGSAGDHRNPE